jgi:16S rRNA (guanine527-N7)-methyltransferase
LDDIKIYFPELSKDQIIKFEKLYSLYNYWNSKINLISRKDFSFFYERHVLHSLTIAKIFNFNKNSSILDIGTGGGFPGIPLAIVFPESYFYLIDGIGKKILAVKDIVNKIELKNIVAKQIRAENFDKKFDFVVSRAVTKIDNLVPLISNNISKNNKHKIHNGLIYLKGGELSREMRIYSNSKEFKIKKIFKNDFFKSKKVLYIPL